MKQCFNNYNDNDDDYNNYDYDDNRWWWWNNHNDYYSYIRIRIDDFDNHINNVDNGYNNDYSAP